MQKLIVTALDKLIDIQTELLNYADLKKTALIERKADELNRLVKEETKLVKQLGQTESERMQLVETLMQEHPTLSFAEFAEQLPDEQVKQKLQLQLKTLQQLTAELQDKNKVNDRLLKDSMSFVQHMIDQITQSQQQQFNYQSPMGQQQKQTSSRGFFDTKA